MSDRIFSQQEVKLLIKRAAKIEAERAKPSKKHVEDGLTLDELKKIALESGLDPDHIEQASSEMENPLPGQEIKVEVNGEEIVSEVWLKVRPGADTIDVLISELNHIYGSKADENIWDVLKGKTDGRVKINRTARYTECSYTSDIGIYSHRVLMKQIGTRFCIRLSKKQMYGMGWENSINTLYHLLPLSILLSVIGGIGTSELVGLEWPGITAGFLLSLAGFPLIRDWLQRYTNKFKGEMINTVKRLIRLVEDSENIVLGQVSVSDNEISSTTDALQKKPSIATPNSGRLQNCLR